MYALVWICIDLYKDIFFGICINPQTRVMPIMFLAEYPVQNQNDANHVIGPYGVSISGDSKFLARRIIAI